MDLKVIGSNSSGNAYLLVGEKETLLIECGVHISKIKQALDFNFNNVNAIVSHSHGDHACSLKDVLNCGINVYSGIETFKAKEVECHHRAKVIKEGHIYMVGGFKIKPFNVNHDVPCFGFLIGHEECGLTLFLTDTYYCDYIFPNLNNIIVECNHSVDIINKSGTQAFLRDRIIKSHMNLQTCKELLKANDLRDVNNIVLIHLSDKNSDAALFYKEIKQLTGKNVHIADAGILIENFNKTPF